VPARWHDEQDARRIGVEVEAEDVLEIGEALLPPKPMSLRKNASISA
jgi:hypothetical protein